MTVEGDKKFKHLYPFYLHILSKLIKEDFLTLFIDVYFLSIINKVIILVCGEFLSLAEQSKSNIKINSGPDTLMCHIVKYHAGQQGEL